MSEKQPASNPEWEGEGNPPPPSYSAAVGAAAYPPPPGYQQPKGPPVTGQPGAYQIPPEQGGAGGIGPGQVTVVVASANAILGPYPQHMACPHCHAQVVTSVEYESGLLTWLLCGGLALFGCIYGCCLIPFCVESCKNAEHHCPNCRQFIGAYRRI